MRRQLLVRGLWALGLALAGACGGSNTGGGAPAACMWVGSGWSCSGGSSGPVNPSGGAGSGGASSGQPDAGGSSAGKVGSDGGAGSGGTTVSMGGDGPAISFMEFNISLPSQPGQIVAGKDGNLWFNHQSTKPSAISKMSPAG